MIHFVLGLDFGPPGEPTGFAVVERPDAKAASTGDYRVRHLERFPPGVSYTDIIAAVIRRSSTPELNHPILVADRTAVGKAVVDRLQCERKAPCVIPVVVGAGQGVVDAEGGGKLVPKKDLVTVLQLLLQSRRLKVAPDLPLAELLVNELAGFRMRKIPVGDAVIEWREGRHDDLVLAVALACWYAETHPIFTANSIGMGKSLIEILGWPKPLFLRERFPRW